jgi:hypothetical protein
LDESEREGGAIVNGREVEPGTVDWLDLGDDPEPGTPAPSRRWRWWWALAAAMVAAALLLSRNQHTTQPLAEAHQPTGPPAGSSQSASPSVTQLEPDLPRQGAPPGPSLVQKATLKAPAESATAATGSITVTTLGHPLLDVPAGWELFGQGRGVVVRMELAHGRVTRTSVPELGSASPIFFVVGNDRAIVHPMDSLPGYVVRDGKPATRLPPALDQAASTLPGPDPWHLWAETEAGTGSALTLLTLDGRPAGVQIPIARDATVQGSDRAGNVLMFGIGGMYNALRDGMHRITTGTLVAVGPTRWLTLECDERYRCASVLIDRTSGTRRTLTTPLDAYQQNAGVISPDGRTVALLQPNGVGGSNVTLMDLDTGGARPTGVRTSSDQTLGGRTFVWSPDSHWLFVTDGEGRVLAIDRTGRVVALDAQVGPVDQLALRVSR